MLETKKGYKKTKLGWIPEDWKEEKIGNVLKIGSGKDYKHLSSGSIPVIGTGGVMTYVDDFLYDGESVGIGRKGTIDKPQYLKGKFWTVDTLFYTYSFKQTQAKYIYYLFSTINWYRFNEASGVPSLSKNTIEKIKIPLPPLPEQQKIATILSTWDKAIDKLTQLIATKKQRKKGLMQQLLKGKKRFAGFTDEWKEVKLGTLTSINMGQSPDSKSYNEDGDGLPLIQGNADLKNRKSSPRVWTSEPTKISEIGDLILTVRAPVGSVAKSFHNACIGRGVCSIKATKCDIEFIYQVLIFFEPRWQSLEQGSTFSAVNSKDIKGLKLKLPNSIQEQQKIASVLSAADKEIELLTNELKSLQQQKKGLMQVLLTGEVRVKIN